MSSAESILALVIAMHEVRAIDRLVKVSSVGAVRSAVLTPAGRERFQQWAAAVGP